MKYLPLQNASYERRIGPAGRSVLEICRSEIISLCWYSLFNITNKQCEQYKGNICPFLILEGITSSRRGRSINKYYVRSYSKAHGKETVTFKLSPEQKQGIVLVTYIPKDLEKPRWRSKRKKIRRDLGKKIGFMSGFSWALGTLQTIDLYTGWCISSRALWTQWRVRKWVRYWEFWLLDMKIIFCRRALYLGLCYECNS